MAKKQPSSPDPPEPRRGRTFEALGKKLDEIPSVRAAEQAVAQAEKMLADARARYSDARDKAVGEAKSLSENPGELWPHVAAWVRKYPGMAMAAAVALGFIVGRGGRK